MNTQQLQEAQSLPVVRRGPESAARSSRRLAAIGGLGVIVGLGVGAWGLFTTEGAGPARPGRAAPVTAMDQGLGVANNSPALASDPDDSRFVILANRLDAPDFGCALQLSGDGGFRWISARPVTSLPEGVEKCYAPEAAFGRGGIIYYLFVGLAGAGNEPVGVFLTTSSNRGRTFTAPRKVLGPRNFAVRMVIDRANEPRGRIHLAWIHATSDPPLGGFGPPPNPLMAAYSDDGGKTFSHPVQVSDHTRARVVAPALALGADGAVYVAYYDLEDDAIDYQGLEGPTWDGTWSLVLSTSSDGGRRFGRGLVIDGSVTPVERVMLIFTMPPPALAAQGNSLCAAWPDGRHGDADVLVRCSQNGGRSWGSFRRVNDDRRGNGRTQYLPRLGMTSSGRLDVIFYDRRHDPQNVLNAVFYSNSKDGGRRFSRNVQITGDMFETRIGRRYVHPSAHGQYDFGSRLALLSESTSVLVAWTDTGNSRLITGSTGQDIFAAEVELPVRRRTTVAWTGAAFLVLCSLALGAYVVRRKKAGAGRVEAEG